MNIEQFRTTLNALLLIFGAINTGFLVYGLTGDGLAAINAGTAVLGLFGA